jgi:hypothetical protein
LSRKPPQKLAGSDRDVFSNLSTQSIKELTAIVEYIASENSSTPAKRSLSYVHQHARFSQFSLTIRGSPLSDCLLRAPSRLVGPFGVTVSGGLVSGVTAGQITTGLNIAALHGTRR